MSTFRKIKIPAWGLSSIRTLFGVWVNSGDCGRTLGGARGLLWVGVLGGTLVAPVLSFGSASEIGLLVRRRRIQREGDELRTGRAVVDEHVHRTDVHHGERERLAHAKGDVVPAGAQSRTYEGVHPAVAFFASFVKPGVDALGDLLTERLGVGGHVDLVVAVCPEERTANEDHLFSFRKRSHLPAPSLREDLPIPSDVSAQ